MRQRCGTQGHHGARPHKPPLGSALERSRGDSTFHARDTRPAAQSARAKCVGAPRPVQRGTDWERDRTPNRTGERAGTRPLTGAAAPLSNTVFVALLLRRLLLCAADAYARASTPLFESWFGFHTRIPRGRASNFGCSAALHGRRCSSPSRARAVVSLRIRS
jgi:hypothetical protein